MRARLMTKELKKYLCFSMLPIFFLSLILTPMLSNRLQAESEKDAIARIDTVNLQLSIMEKEIDAINLTFSINNEITSAFARYFLLGDASEYSTLSKIQKSYMIPTVVSRDYIHSLYIYFDNDQDILLADSVGITKVNTLLDSDWMNTYEEFTKSGMTQYTQARNIHEFSFQKTPTRVISVFHKFFLHNGVIILNLNGAFFDKLLAEQCLSPKQLFFVTNEDYEILMQNDPAITPDQEQLAQMKELPFDQLTRMRLNGTDYLVMKHQSDSRYKWVYVSLLSEADIYSARIFFIAIFSLALCVSVLICFIASWKHSKSYCANCMNVLYTLNDFGQNKAAVSDFLPSEKDDFYSYVTREIIHNYAERNELRQIIQQKQQIVRELEMEALQSQINPHFLFNTLKSIYWMSLKLTEAPNQVSSMVEDMTDILEYSLNSTDEFATLAEEIQNTKSYIAIQHARYQNRFRVIWNYDAEIEKYYTIKLLLQPLIENAIMHGMPWEDAKLLTIKISLWKEEQQIHIKVEDDGVGIESEKMRQIQERLKAQEDDRHIGLFSCNRRLCLSFGDDCGLKISSVHGTTITFHFPCIQMDNSAMDTAKSPSSKSLPHRG